MFKNHSGDTSFEDIKGSRRAAEACHCEKAWKATGEGAASVAVDGPELKGSCKGFEAWHHEESLWGGYWQSLLAEDPSVLEMPVPWDDH